MDFDGAESEVSQALEVNPNHTGAYFVRAGIALRDLDIESADRAADKGLAVNPTNLELLSMKAAIRFLADDRDGFVTYKRKVLAQDPEYAGFFLIVSEYAEWEHRYDDIVGMMREAIQTDKRDAQAHAVLGFNLIRSGDDAGGLASLKAAWDLDKFNVRVFNTLNLYEKEVAHEYVTVPGAMFNIRYNQDEKAILERYVPQMLQEAWGSMVQRYGFVPTTPVTIELYADTAKLQRPNQRLAQRGYPGRLFWKDSGGHEPQRWSVQLGKRALARAGTCLCHSALEEPRATLVHRGVSEYETIVRRPEWQREEDPALFAALKAGRIPAVERFNRAFTHAQDVEDMTMAYYAASQILVFMAQELGFPRS